MKDNTIITDEKKNLCDNCINRRYDDEYSGCDAGLDRRGDLTEDFYNNKVVKCSSFEKPQWRINL